MTHDLGLLFRKRTAVSRAFVTGLARHRAFLAPEESPAALLVSYTLAVFFTKVCVTPLEVSERVAQIIGSEGVARLEQGTSVLFDITKGAAGSSALWAGLKTDLQILLPAIVFENMMYSVFLPLSGVDGEAGGKPSADDGSSEDGQSEDGAIAELAEVLGLAPQPSTGVVGGLSKHVEGTPARPPVLLITESADERDRDDVSVVAPTVDIPTELVARQQPPENIEDDTKDADSIMQPVDGTVIVQSLDNRSDISEGAGSWLQSDDDEAEWWPSGSGSVRSTNAPTPKEQRKLRENSPSKIPSGSNPSDQSEPGDVGRRNRVNSTSMVERLNSSPGQSPSMTQTLTAFLRRRLGGSNEASEPVPDASPALINPLAKEAQEGEVDTKIAVSTDGEALPSEGVEEEEEPGEIKVAQSVSSPTSASEMENFFQSDPEPLASDLERPTVPPLTAADLTRSAVRSSPDDGETARAGTVQHDWRIAALAKLSSTIVTHPLNMLRQRKIAVQCGVGNVPASAATLSDCLRDTVPGSRRIFALGCGFWPAALQGVLFVAIKEIFLRRFKAMNAQRFPEDDAMLEKDERILSKFVLYEYSAAFLAESMLYPMTVVIRRLHVAYRTGGGPARGIGARVAPDRPFLKVCLDIFRREGWRGFFAGFSYHLSSAISIYLSTLAMFSAFRLFFRHFGRGNTETSSRSLPPNGQARITQRRRHVSFSELDDPRIRRIRERFSSFDRRNHDPREGSQGF